MKRIEYIGLIILSTIMLLDLNYIVIFVSGLIYFSSVYLKEIKNSGHVIAFLRVLVLSIPFSFINIFGADYGDFSLSWYNLFFLILGTIYLLKVIICNNVDASLLSKLSIIMLFITLFIFFKSIDYRDSFRDLINNSIPLILLLYGLYFRRDINIKKQKLLMNDYIIGTVTACLGVLFQFILIRYQNTIVGNFQNLGGYRDAYGYLFSDYSFLSLYIVTGAFLIIYLSNNMSKYLFAIIMLFASIVTSARTGIISFLLIYSALNIIYFYKSILKGKIEGIVMMLINILVLTITYLGLKNIRKSALLSDSGRGNLNEEAFRIFSENPISGIGFGANHYAEISGILPHNLFFQSLAQGGIIYFIPLIFFIISLLFFAYKNKKELFFVLLIIFMGSLFIPNIFSSRYLGVILLLIGLSIPIKKYGKTGEI